jgi:hypothetical protein
MAKVKLNPLQSKFLLDLSRMVIYAHKLGYTVTDGRGFVSPEANRAEGGKKNSLHLVKLAHDLCFFKDGVYLRETDELRIFGDWWKDQGSDHAWGGDFKDSRGRLVGDGNHFSIKYGGMK